MRLPVKVIERIAKWVSPRDRGPITVTTGRAKITIQPHRVYSAREDRWYTVEEWRKKNG